MVCRDRHGTVVLSCVEMGVSRPEVIEIDTIGWLVSTPTRVPNTRGLAVHDHIE